ncbi:hypothetical protein [Bacillus suaedae]|uniref:Uncharacterized protein n=1 Tax=Halalkalibacter suaedae TaxID=2822140 RepID=A0A941ANN8_9BACI|nr:hypothetical protein [Bacillus suaedae]MBP3951850.1 hypothetical protein [Bacillus suaedae]
MEMNKETTRKQKQPGVLKCILIEIRDSIIFEIIWSIVTFIPRTIIRVIRNMN